jgi:putative hydrolase of the HAD superfamily
MVRAVFFDLDDTLFDHHHCARTALQAVQSCHSCFSTMTLSELEAAHSRFLEELHQDVIAGRRRLDDARRERFRRLFGAAGVEADDRLADHTAAAYRERYRAVRKAVHGAPALLPLVRERALVGVISNNLLEEQQEKLRFCGLASSVDALVVSEEAGVAKPDPAIFSIALGRLGCAPEEAVMLGDSWASDVVGARAAGVRAVWFNRYGAPAPEGGVLELRSLDPPDQALRTLFGADRD